MEGRQILERLLEVHVEPIDGVRPGDGLYDLEVCWPAHPHWAVEVKSETDRLSLATLSALERRGYTVATDLLRSRWVVGLLREASVKRIREELPEYLAAVEAEGWTELIRLFAEHSAAIRVVVDRFDIWHGKAEQSTEQPRLVLMPPEPVDPLASRVEGVNDVIEKWASRDDVRAKLGRSGLSERHLFVWVAEDAPDVAWPLQEARFPPADPPSLPAEVTAAWIATGDLERPVVWFVQPPQDWKVLAGHHQLWPGERIPEPPRPR